jgi:hypothetical protein
MGCPTGNSATPEDGCDNNGADREEAIAVPWNAIATTANAPTPGNIEAMFTMMNAALEHFARALITLV